MRYCMQYLKTKNVNLVKDMGMIPYKLMKNHNYDSKVATFKDGEYPYLNNEVKGLKIDFIKRFFNSYSLDGGLYLIRESKNIDILQIFHVTISSFVYAFIYKILNKNGKIYLKLDCSHKLIERINTMGRIEKILFENFFNKVDLISVEQEELFFQLKNLLTRFSSKIINITNGIDFQLLDKMSLKYDYDIKENIILNVARIGSEEKNTKMLLEAFAKIDGIERSGWKLKLIGEIEPDFYKYLEDYFKRYKNLKTSIIIAGEIVNRKQLFEEYQKAKIFSLTSDFESFGIAFIEAGYFGNVIVSTDVGIAKEITKEGNGYLVPINDINALTLALSDAINDKEIQRKSINTHKLCTEKFDWDKIIAKLNKELQALMK